MSATTTSNEHEVWTGTPSQLRHVGLYTLCGLVALALIVASVVLAKQSSSVWWLPFALIVLPLAVAAARFLRTRFERITLTDQRLILRRGILNRSTDYVELYRIKDSHFTQPIAERVLGLGTIRLRTTQDSAPVVELTGMRSPEPLWNQIRTLVEARRDAKGVREIDMNTETGGG